MMFLYIGTIIGICGLIFDIAGAYFLSKGLIKKPIRKMEREAGFSFGVNHEYVAGSIQQKIDSKVGFSLMLLGFVMQSAAYIEKQDKINIGFCLIPILFVIIIIVVAILLDKRIKSKIIKDYLKNEVWKRIEGKDKNEQLYHPDDSKFLLEIINVSYSESETPMQLQEKLFKELNI